LSLGTVFGTRGGSGLVMRRGAGGSVLSSGSGGPSLQTVMEEGAEGETGDEVMVQSASLILNGNGNLALHEGDGEEHTIPNPVKHGRRATVPPDPKSSAFKTVHVPAKHYHFGSSENGSSVKVRFEGTKKKHDQIGILDRVIRFLFTPLRLVRWVLVGLLGGIVRM